MSTMVKSVAQALQQEMGTAPFDETAAFALAHAAIAATMPAMGQKQTFCKVAVMSALPPKARWPCPLCAKSGHRSAP
jgi:hypothetical protein